MGIPRDQSSRSLAVRGRFFSVEGQKSSLEKMNSRRSEVTMGMKVPGLVISACLLAAATVAVPDEPIGLGVPASAHLNRGTDWCTKSEIDKAISEYNEAIRLDPASASAYCCRALAWYDKHDLDKAVADGDEAIRLDPKQIWAYNNRGNAWAAKQEFAKAIADYIEAIRLDPSFAVAYKNRAWIRATFAVGAIPRRQTGRWLRDAGLGFRGHHTGVPRTPYSFIGRS
jgi:tetratricopeptide (TPR) repeat protein